jgi:peptidoglycan hydrolase-like protein with peptidoglycan-binding domain
MVCVAYSAQPSKSTRKAAPKAAPKKAPAKKKTVTASSKKKSTARARTSSSRRRRPSYRAGQQKPAPERYADIQRALAQRGYFSGETDGKWGDHSVEALKKFQASQNLKPDGKLSSLSLIALGLGPKRLESVQQPPLRQQPPPAPQ